MKYVSCSLYPQGPRYPDRAVPAAGSPLHRDVDCNSDPGIPAVIEVIAVIDVVDVDVVVVIPVISPGCRPRVNRT